MSKGFVANFSLCRSLSAVAFTFFGALAKEKAKADVFVVKTNQCNLWLNSKLSAFSVAGLSYQQSITKAQKKVPPNDGTRGFLVRPKLPPMLPNTHQVSRDTQYAIRNHRIYDLILRQSSIKQQSVYAHWPFDVPKQAAYPSAV